VPKKTIQNATTWGQGIWLGASVTGHAIVGFLIAILGEYRFISNNLRASICGVFIHVPAHT